MNMITKSKLLALFGAGSRLSFIGDWSRGANGAAYAAVSIEAVVLSRRLDGREHVVARTTVERRKTAFVDYECEEWWWGSKSLPGEGRRQVEAEIASACERWADQPTLPAEIEAELLKSEEEIAAYASWRWGKETPLEDGGRPKVVSVHKWRHW